MEYIGVDVGKLNLDIFYLNQNVRIENSTKKIELFLRTVLKLKNPFVICEATGGYEQPLIQALKKELIAFCIVHPNKIRAFAKSKGLLGKTDKLDAKLLFDYASMFKPEADKCLKTDGENELLGLLKRREQLQQDKIREQNRLDKILSSSVKKSIEEHIEWLDDALQDVEKEIVKLQKNDEEIKSKTTLLTSVPCIGKHSASYLICYLPELGRLNHKEIASLVGVAPFNRDSGMFQGKRYIRGGRPNLRKILYMAALSATRCGNMKVFYNRLKDNGKPGKVALIAVVRKLLTILNSIVKRQTPWIENLQLKAA
jgi:transposase